MPKRKRLKRKENEIERVRKRQRQHQQEDWRHVRKDSKLLKHLKSNKAKKLLKKYISYEIPGKIL